MARKSNKRIRSAEYVAKVWKELKPNVSAVARRIGYTPEGTARFLNRLGLRTYTR